MNFNCEERQRLETRINAVTDCCICMDTIQITNKAVTECGHVFCLNCLLQHTKNKNDCPMCRHTLGPEPPEPRVDMSTFGSILNVVLGNDALRDFIITSIFDERLQLIQRQQAQRQAQQVQRQAQQAQRQAQQAQREAQRHAQQAQRQQVRRQRELSRCGICRQYGHNRRTCRHVQEQDV